MKQQEGKRKVNLKKNSDFKPIKRFHWFLIDEFRDIRVLLVEIQSLEDKETDLIIKEALIKYTIIKTVSIFENFFKSMAFHIGSDISIELDKVLKKGFEEDRGSALAHSYPHSNPKMVIAMYKKLLNRDMVDDAQTYFDNFNNEGIEHEVYHIRRIPLLSRNWDNFYRLFEYRNKIIHEGFSPSVKYSELRNMVGATFDVMAVAQEYGWKFDLH